MNRITVLAFYDRIAVYHSLKPFLYCPRDEIGGYRFTFTDSPSYCLEKDRNEVLIVLRRFLKPVDAIDHDLMRRLRAKYRRIAYFNGHPGAGLHHRGVIEYVDLFYNKSLLRDRSAYLRPLYGDELFTDYYHRKHGFSDDPDETSPPLARAADLEKLRLSWNVGIGDFPRPKFGQRAGVALARGLGLGWSRFFSRRHNPPPRRNAGTVPIHARLGYQKRPTIAAQRRIMVPLIENHALFLTGPKIAQKQYNREIRDSRVVFSPFGLGELCFRDFEAVQSGALLLKPDMAHVETWPDIFHPGETYVPVRWDGTDLVEVGEAYLENERERRRIVENALLSHRDQERDMCRRFSSAMAEIVGDA